MFFTKCTPVCVQVTPFWPRVMHTLELDLNLCPHSQTLNLPAHKRMLKFEFIDPLWAWVRAAYDQPAEHMQWVPEKKTSIDSDEPYYGGGGEFGEAFAEAYRTCPAGSFPMCVSLHWDGTHARGVYATPICIGVANTNSMAPNTQYCIGYVPVLSDLGAAFQSVATELKYHIRNQCVAAILKVLEAGARTGVRCRLPSMTPGELEEERVLMPRLMSMNLDQPEAQLYFGMRNRM